MSDADNLVSLVTLLDEMSASVAIWKDQFLTYHVDVECSGADGLHCHFIVHDYSLRVALTKAALSLRTLRDAEDSLNGKLFRMEVKS